MQFGLGKKQQPSDTRDTFGLKPKPEVAPLDCTDGTEHAASKLYGACWRVAQQLGYRRMLTYVLNTEPGTTLKAAGWKCYGEAGGGSWSREGRPRVDLHPTQTKIRWEAA